MKAEINLSIRSRANASAGPYKAQAYTTQITLYSDLSTQINNSLKVKNKRLLRFEYSPTYVTLP